MLHLNRRILGAISVAIGLLILGQNCSRTAVHDSSESTQSSKSPSLDSVQIFPQNNAFTVIFVGENLSHFTEALAEYCNLNAAPILTAQPNSKLIFQTQDQSAAGASCLFSLSNADHSSASNRVQGTFPSATVSPSLSPSPSPHQSPSPNPSSLPTPTPTPTPDIGTVKPSIPHQPPQPTPTPGNTKCIPDGYNPTPPTCQSAPCQTGLANNPACCSGVATWHSNTCYGSGGAMNNCAALCGYF